VNATAVPLEVTLESKWKSVNGTIITHPDPNGFNYKNNQTAIVPEALKLGGASKPPKKGAWTWSVPAYSITVLQFDL
jgi:alpha-N-arabinofuranosidase